MTSRTLLFTLAAALLYLGPLLGGMSGLSGRSLPLFAAICMIWLVVMRPALWPNSDDDWMAGNRLPRIALVVILQIVAVAVVFGLGRGFAALLDARATLPVWLPYLLSLAALPLALFAVPRRPRG